MYVFVCKGLSIDDVGVSGDTVFQEIRPGELVLKPATSLKNSWGGYRRTPRGGRGVGEFLSMYCVNPSRRHQGMSLRSWELAHGLQCSTETRRSAPAPGMPVRRSEERS